MKISNDDKIIIKKATNVQIMPDYPYIGGDSDYFEFINKIFFFNYSIIILKTSFSIKSFSVCSQTFGRIFEDPIS